MEPEQIIQIEEILTNARFLFAVKCLYRFNLIKPTNDIVFSPHSIYEGLLSVYFMSSGAIEERLKHILYLSDVSKYDLIQYYSLKRDSKQSKNNAASSDYDDERRCWIKTTKFNHLISLKNIFNNGFEVFDPDNTFTEKTVRINMAIQSAVINHICFPVEFGEVREDMELVLMTVSRLNVQKFKISKTCDPLRLDKRRRKCFFSHELNMHVSEFPYKNENMSLFVFSSGLIKLARARGFPIYKDICALIERLSSKEVICKLRNLLDSDTPWEVTADYVCGLTFYLERNMPMRELLRELGIEELLKPDAINLDSFFVDDDSVHLGNVVHRTHVKVTEEDTVAGAVNVIYAGQEDYLVPSSVSKEIPICKLPLVWLIYDKQCRNVLFVGGFNKYGS